MSAIIPSVLAKDFNDFKRLVRRYENLVDFIEVDIADGRFVPNGTFADPVKIQSYPWVCDFGLHLMISRPEETLAQWLETGAKRIIVHLEASAKIAWIIDQLRARGIEGGLALKLETPIRRIVPYLSEVDLVMLLAVAPGFYGAPFQPSVLERIRFLRQQWPSGKIEVDGGLHPQTLPQVKAAGADLFVIGSELANAVSLAEKLKELEKLVQ